mmetsp:Transcript_24379/g.83342  ORF Transcript_24379/g.83342 Transcript_24379/m.83342 type:complete len:208 (+) Transcript_24379:178-801(+)|eukprot:CAMPEP_0183788888 /NCGR_PEP_ID=MMETSP0803_2-20130417/31_1 /TAXON_ID=195967 /ORGANISM="Crustomastix stigmata, Strain CCMP3273" /LENGTH=207 /DNA_ID=CAMNT_0026033037 /DNA_START=94 /DNA_END=717 /DNA_ORIENTATION=-
MSVQAGNFYTSSGASQGNAQSSQLYPSAQPTYAQGTYAPYTQVAPQTAPPGYWAYAQYGGGHQVVGDGSVIQAEVDTTPQVITVSSGANALPVTVARGLWTLGEGEKDVPNAVRERDVKLQRRKEANRESARRSKQRKKEESEQLARRAQELAVEGATLRTELERLEERCLALQTENQTLRSKLSKSVVVQETSAGNLHPPQVIKIS